MKSIAFVALLVTQTGLFGAATYNISNTPGGPSTSIGFARYRLNPSNWDQALGSGSVIPANIINNNLGNVATLNNRTMQFSLQHIAGQGLIFRLTDTSPNPLNLGNPYTLSWGSFTTPPGGTTTPALNGLSGNSLSFNGLQLYAKTRNNGTGTTSSLSFSNFAFSGTGLSAGSGSFPNSTTMLSSPPNGDVNHYLTASDDLGDYNWLLTGEVTGFRSFTTGCDECVAFQVSLLQVVPEPGFYAVLAIGLTALVLVRRRMHA